MCLFVCLTSSEMLSGLVAAVAKLRRHIRRQIVTLIVVIAVCVVIVADTISFVTHGCDPLRCRSRARLAQPPLISTSSSAVRRQHAAHEADRARLAGKLDEPD